MGAWGTGLFSDDLACDIRDQYRDLIGTGHTGPKATEILLKEWKQAIMDSEDGPVFWLALASTQWKCGRIEKRVKAKAIEIIDKGADLVRWKDDLKSLKRRQAVLAKLKLQLESPPPPKRRIVTPYKETCDWEVGELIAYQLRTGRWVIFHMIGTHTEEGGTSPVVELLQWIGNTIPSKDAMKRLPRVKDPDCSEEPLQFILAQLKANELPIERIKRLGFRIKPAKEPGGYSVIFWKDIDPYLKRLLRTRRTL